MGSAQGQGLTPAADCRAPLLMGSSQQSRDGVLIGMPVYVKELIAGGVAGGFAKTAVAPLERVKILFQTKKGDFQSLGVWRSLGKIFRTEGVLGFYRGNGASVVRIVPYAALHFMTYEQYRRWIVDYFPGIGTGPVVDLLAGSVAGGTAVLCTYPLDLARTRLAYEVKSYYRTGWDNHIRSVHLESAYRGITDVFTKVYREGGLRGLYRGVGPSLYGILPYAGLKFFVYEELKSHAPKEQQTSMVVKLACGSLAGLLGQTFTYPLDVVRRQMQVQTLSITQSGSSSVQLTEPELKGTFEGLVTVVQRQGWKQLFAGLSINYLKVVPSVAIGFTAYDGMKSWLGVPPREKTKGRTAE